MLIGNIVRGREMLSDAEVNIVVVEPSAITVVRLTMTLNV